MMTASDMENYTEAQSRKIGLRTLIRVWFLIQDFKAAARAGYGGMNYMPLQLDSKVKQLLEELGYAVIDYNRIDYNRDITTVWWAPKHGTSKN